MKPSWIVILFILILSGCNSGHVSTRLAEIDSLVVREQYDSACVILKDVAGASMTDEEQAHYNLLTTQLGYLTNQLQSSDSLLDLAIAYYKQHQDDGKLADCYYYKSNRGMMSGDYPQAIQYCKEAEQLAQGIRQQYKIAERITFLNELSGNFTLQLEYAKKTLGLASFTDKKIWIAYSYSNIGAAFSNLDKYDSALYYFDKTIPYIKYVDERNKARFLANIGMFYKGEDLGKAKEYFQESLRCEETSGVFENLADVYYMEGKQEEAYKLWKKALTIDDGDYKDNIIHSILSYDIEHGHVEKVCDNIDEIIHIKDSMLHQLKNDTIKDLQLRFDHEVAMRKQEQITSYWQKGVLFFALIVMTLIASIVILRYREKNRIQDIQVQLSDLMRQKRELEASGEKKSETIEGLNKEIDELLAKESLREGQALYEQIEGGGTALNWTSREETLFCKYYASVNYQEYHRLRKVKRASRISDHKMPKIRR